LTNGAGKGWGGKEDGGLHKGSEHEVDGGGGKGLLTGGKGMAVEGTEKDGNDGNAIVPKGEHEGLGRPSRGMDNSLDKPVPSTWKKNNHAFRMPRGFKRQLHLSSRIQEETTLFLSD
jgi:hypothetical protein